MKKSYLIYFFILLSSLCYSQGFETKQGGHVYSLEVPNYLKKTYDLNDVATLEYKNLIKDVYLVVVEDEKEELKSVEMEFSNSNEFLEYFIKDYYIDAEKRELSETKEFNNNGNKFSQVELTFQDADGEYFMLITIVETKTHFYKILNWTALKNKDKYYKDFIKTAKSLQD